MAALLGTFAVVLASWAVQWSATPAAALVLLALSGLVARFAWARDRIGRTSPGMTARYASQIALTMLGTGAFTICYSVVAAATGALPRPLAGLQAGTGLALLILSRPYRTIAADLASGQTSA